VAVPESEITQEVARYHWTVATRDEVMKLGKLSWI
jgi:hypothetical protein